MCDAKFPLNQTVQVIKGRGLLIFQIGKIGTIIGFDDESHYRYLVEFSNGEKYH